MVWIRSGFVGEEIITELLSSRRGETVPEETEHGFLCVLRDSARTKSEPHPVHPVDPVKIESASDSWIGSDWVFDFRAKRQRADSVKNPVVFLVYPESVEGLVLVFSCHGRPSTSGGASPTVRGGLQKIDCRPKSRSMNGVNRSSAFG